MDSSPQLGLTRLAAALRGANGDPRYTLSVPVASLADERRFAEYQAEMVGGLDREVRAFLDDALRDGDHFVDVGAGLGIHAFGAATAPGRAARVVCVVEDERAAALLLENARANGLEERVEARIAPSLADAPLDELCASGSGRVILRVADGSDLPGVLARGAEVLAGGRLAAVLWPRQPQDGGQVSLADRIVRQSLAAFGYSHLALVEDDAGPVLVPLENAPEARTVFSLSPALLEAAPPAKEGWFGERFVVLSAGPLSRTGGHDRVAVAFREFHRRHPEALLIAAWHNAAPEGPGDLAADGRVEGRPETNEFGQMEVRPWLIANGLAPQSVIDPGPEYAERLPELLREADVAIFAPGGAADGSAAPGETRTVGVPTLVADGTEDLLAGLESHYRRRQEGAT